MVLNPARYWTRVNRLLGSWRLGGPLFAAVLLAASTSASAADGWVRTRDGWEREESLRPHRVYEPAVHPLVVTSLVTLATLFGLVAFSRWNVSKSDDTAS